MRDKRREAAAGGRDRDGKADQQSDSLAKCIIKT